MREHHPKRGMRYLGIALGITISFFAIELVGGFLTNSLALLTDAWHMLNDSFSLTLTLIAAWFAQRPITTKRTYGYYRAEIIAAFLNGVFLWAVVVFIFYEALQRIQQPVEVESFNMILIAVFGLIANGLSAMILSRSRDNNLNIKGAFLHLLADTLGSIGAISAGLIMYFTGWYQADPLISMIIGVLIFYSSWGLIRESLNILLEGVPPHIELTAVEHRIVELEGVKSVHDLHVWSISSSKMPTMSAHIIVEKEIDKKKLMETLINILKDEFEIIHTTIQLEETDYPKAVGEH